MTALTDSQQGDIQFTHILSGQIVRHLEDIFKVASPALTAPLVNATRRLLPAT
jgi:hypothetical protein